MRGNDYGCNQNLEDKRSRVDTNEIFSDAMVFCLESRWDREV